MNATMSASTSRDVRYVRIADPTGRHVVFTATFACNVDALMGRWNREPDMEATAFDFDDPQVAGEACIRLMNIERESSKPSMVMIGSIENGHWVNWELAGTPAPPVPNP